MNEPILRVENLAISLVGADAAWPLVSELSFEIRRGETLCLVGESGCGKSLTALSIIGLLDRKLLRPTAGRILFEGRDLLALPEPEMRALRGNRIAMVFQEPMTSLNPVQRIGRQIAEVIAQHRGTGEAAAEAEAVALLDRVRIPDARRRAREYPHQLSGGMRQRVMIAMALALRPALLIADEPTTALDVTIQGQVLALIDELRREFGTSVLLITHDLGVVAEAADRVVVLYGGRAVEEAGCVELFDRPHHPYTAGLLGAIRELLAPDRMDRLTEIPGTVPSPAERGPGCGFAPRCAYAFGRCNEARPAFETREFGHGAACWLPDLASVAGASR
ncbi:ABC transporter ATP-binding protein [Mesorhizobium sp. L-8-10]|uniref:ABC transporter ATP-binding protein n=1 Tax=Mesorhizobium sp. L-8-10 TaxID=2744523 RepID=UPI001928B14D|nr:ABC transporter ATP-binding protein [Mesorhizobium sp. L-8-10]BCH29287.1 ABC transporter ATP-binding protein [Mesorhizobium sp. L-8-10]